MCGIAGIVGAQSDACAALEAMMSALEHRGPDDAGSWISPDGGVALAHRRLSIIDLSPLGRNPMPNDDKTLWITYNGEVYNFQELRRELEGFGCRFRSQTDTEVVLAAYDRWGLDCLDKLAGMFAFALWDSPRRRLFLARDRLGKKPLYYAEYAGRLVFASELKALLADPDFPREVDPDALSLYLRYGYIPAPYSIFRAARKLPPAHHAVWEDGRLSVRRYWDPVDIALSGQYEGDEREAQQRLETLLKESVRGRMIADVPLGAFLSGGIDSSLIVALMQEQSARPVKTFTIQFENPEYNEAKHAAAVAKHLGTEHYEETCGLSQMLRLVDVIPNSFDEPFADSSAIPTYLVSKITRQHVTVALSGDGGDELFFGYPRFHVFSRMRWLLRTPSLLRNAAATALSVVPRRRWRRAADVLRENDEDSYARLITWWSPPAVARLTGRAAIESPVYAETRRRLASLPRNERPLVLDLMTYLPEDILTKVDRASMAVSLEVRNPLLDHRVVEFALRLPLRMKWRGGVSKWLLRQLLSRRVPRHLIERPKMGFGVPLADWFRGPLRERMEAALSGDRLEGLGLDPAPARAVWSDFLSGRTHRTDRLWSLFALTCWIDRWAVPSASPASRVAAGV